MTGHSEDYQNAVTERCLKEAIIDTYQNIHRFLSHLTRPCGGCKNPPHHSPPRQQIPSRAKLRRAHCPSPTSSIVRRARHRIRKPS